MHVLTEDADTDGNVVEEVVIVSTDIEAPKAVPFADFELADGTTPQELDANPETDGGMDYQSLGIDSGGTNDNLGMLETDGITATGAGTVTLLAAVADDPSTMDVDETVMAFSTPAMFNGASGTLTCGGATNCTATLRCRWATLQLSPVAGFSPPMKMPPPTNRDYDYLHYGFWLQRTTDSDDEVTYDEVETFAGSSVAASGSVASVTGQCNLFGQCCWRIREGNPTMRWTAQSIRPRRVTSLQMWP